MNQKAPTNWSKERKDFFEKEQKYGLSQEVKDFSKRTQELASKFKKLIKD